VETVDIIPRSQAECNQLASLAHSNGLVALNLSHTRKFKVGTVATVYSDKEYFTQKPSQQVCFKVITANELQDHLNKG
jgi:hypothetical protein